MQTRSLMISAALIFVLMLGLAGLGMAADRFVGTWNWNAAKSKINAGLPDKRGLSTFTAQDNGLKLVGDGVDGEGKAYHVAWAATFDGKDYPATGFTDVDTIAIKRIDTNTFSELFKKAGKEVFGASVAVSKDGKTLTRTVKVKSAKGQEVINTAVYDKQ